MRTPAYKCYEFGDSFTFMFTLPPLLLPLVMPQDFRPEDIATVQRALVSLVVALLLAAGLLSLFALRHLASFSAALRTLIPQRVRTPLLAVLLVLGIFAASVACFRWLTERNFPTRTAETLTLEFAQRTLIVTCAAMVSLALGLRLMNTRAPIWLRLAAELLLVPCAYAIGLAIIHLALPLTDLESWNGFQRAAFYSAAVFALPVALIPGFYRPRGFAVVMGFLLLVVFGDLIYLRYFGNILPVLAIGGGGQLWDVRDIIVKYTRGPDAWLLLVFVVSVALPFLWPKPNKADAPLAVRGVIDLSLVCTSVAFLLPLPGLVQRWMDSDRSWRVLNGTDAVQDSGIVVAHIKEIARSIRDARRHGSISEDEFAKLRKYHEARAVPPTALSNDPDFGLARATNLLLLQVEGMQKWVIGAHHRGQPLTPFLNRLRDRGWFFDRLYDETGDSSTSDCEYMVLNSQFPIPQGSVAFRRDENHFVTLLHSFKEVGYTTFAGHAYAAGMWNRAVLYPRYGFDQTAFKDELGDGPKLGWGIGDKPFFQRVLPRIEQLKAPFVSMLITLTSHSPYQYVPVGERKLQLGPIEGSDFGGYLHSMRYNDEAIEQLFAQLEKSGLLANTTVVIYGDHDSRMKFSSRLMTETDLNPETQRRLAIRDYTTKQIPLLVVLPERLKVAPRLVHTIGGQVDIGATVLHLFGLKQPRSFIGQSLVPERAGHASRIDGSGVDDQHIYIAPGGGRCESFPDFQRLERAECAELSRRTQEELNMSWSVTLLDLAGRLAGKVPDKAAATR
ncbi:MAG TPA: LTA synthase family protein [Polyangiaceae bacterium]|nr:LTA synthase family protein [Polyangiaceae bacterium]